METRFYAFMEHPRYWVIHDRDGYWLVPARENGWQQREPFVGRVAGLHPLTDPGNIDLGIPDSAD